MKKLSELFYECVYRGNWQTINDVDFKFVENKDTLEIYFMGSSQVLDWVRNFMFKKRPYKDMQIPYRVHRGFLEAWKEVEDVIIAKIKERVVTEVSSPYADPEANITPSIAPIIEYKWKKVVVIGYSHGGALAAFCHECVWFWRPDLRETGLIGYGFEAPRIFGGFSVPKILQERWQNFFVIRTNNDLVTHCPPALFRFCHVGDIIKVKGNTDLAPKKWYIPKCIKSHYPEVVYDALVRFENGEK